MQLAEIQEEYLKIIGEHQSEILASIGDAGTEKREHPRLKVKSNDLWIDTVPEFQLVDLSASGMSIHSNYPLKRGEVIHVSLGTVISAEAEVVLSQMEQSPDEYTDGVFRIRLRFIEDLAGMTLLVKTVRADA